MNFFRRKFSFSEEDGADIGFEDPSPSQPPSAFSFQAIANKVSSTISAPTSPARTTETLAAALERSLANDRSRAPPIMHPDARVLLVIDNQYVDWSKYFRNPNDIPIRVEQADFPDLDLMCTEHSCIVEINQPGKDTRSFAPHAVFVGPGAQKGKIAKTILRALVSSQLPFLNSHKSILQFMDKCNLKKELRKITLADGSRIPLLPSIHYPHFHKFHPSTSFPVVVSVNEGHSGIGKMKVNSYEELCDLEGMIQVMQQDVEVEVEPMVDIKYDLHVQKIGKEFKTFVRRGISRNWKSNVGSAVLEQMNTNERHKDYLRTISSYVGEMSIISLDILVSREGREFVHNINDVVAFFGESQEEDRRNICQLLKKLIAPQGCMPVSLSRGQLSNVSDTNSSPSSGFTPTSPPSSATPTQKKSPPPMQNGNGRPMPPPNRATPSQNGTHVPRPHRSPSNNSTGQRDGAPPPPHAPPQKNGVMSQRQSMDRMSQSEHSENHTFAEDTMGQLKRTFAGIFGDVN